MSSGGTWGPFLPGLDRAERKARLRSLRMAVRLLCGHRGAEVRYRLLRAEIEDGDALDLARAEFDRLGSIDRRRVLASYQAEA